jgi:uncharacterized protein
VHLSTTRRSAIRRSGDRPVPRRVRHRTPGRSGGRSQSAPASAAHDPSAARLRTGLLVDRGSSPSSRTDVRSAPIRHARARTGGEDVARLRVGAVGAFRRPTNAAPGIAAPAGRSGGDVTESGIPGQTLPSHTLPRQTVSIRLVLLYQRLFDGRPSPCRFTPSCSAYALEALEVHGTMRGQWLTLRRLVRCRPFGPSGWDPVPEAAAHATTACEKGC